MLSAWAKHLKDDKEKEQFEEYVRRCSPLLERLGELLKEEEDNLNLSEVSVISYDKPNWDYLQAHKNGFRQCLNIIKQLIALDRRGKK